MPQKINLFVGIIFNQFSYFIKKDFVFAKFFKCRVIIIAEAVIFKTFGIMKSEPYNTDVFAFKF